MLVYNKIATKRCDECGKKSQQFAFFNKSTPFITINICKKCLEKALKELNKT